MNEVSTRCHFIAHSKRERTIARQDTRCEVKTQDSSSVDLSAHDNTNTETTNDKDWRACARGQRVARNQSHKTEVGGVRLALPERDFCHFVNYEPDAAAPSGRALHRYAEAHYPSVRAWRAAHAARETVRHARRLADLRARDAEDEHGSAANDDGWPLCREAPQMLIDPLARARRIQELGVTPSRWYAVAAPAPER